MMKTKTNFIIIFLFILSFKSKNVFSQTVEEIYLQLPDEYIHSPLSYIATTYKDGIGNRIDKKILKKILFMNLSEINQMADSLRKLKLQVKIIDTKNSFIQFCDNTCLWEFTMKIFNDKNAKPKYVAIWSGNNDGATSGTNKKFHFLEISKNKNSFTFKNVWEKFEPIITYKQVIDSILYQKYKSSIDNYFQKENENLLDSYDLHQYESIVIGYLDGTGMLFYDTYQTLPKEIKITVDSMHDKKIVFKWDGIKFDRLN